MRLVLVSLVVGSLSLLPTGCDQATKTALGPSAEGSAYRLDQAPEGAKDVKQVRLEAKDGDDVVVEGRIGGEANPWVEGQAAFLVVDSSLKPCASDEGCKTPWDYCCDTDLLPASKAMVKIVDKHGKTVATDAKTLLGVKELQTVVAKGKAHRDDAGNLTILADGIFVRN